MPRRRTPDTLMKYRVWATGPSRILKWTHYNVLDKMFSEGRYLERVSGCCLSRDSISARSATTAAARAHVGASRDVHRCRDCGIAWLLYTRRYTQYTGESLSGCACLLLISKTICLIDLAEIDWTPDKFKGLIIIQTFHNFKLWKVVKNRNSLQPRR